MEVGFVGHLLLLRALEKSGLTEDDIELVNVRTNETPMVLASGEVTRLSLGNPVPLSRFRCPRVRPLSIPQRMTRG